jgi:hypothetical protein
VGIGIKPNQTPVICIEPEGEVKTDKGKLEKELLAIAVKHELTKDIKTILFHKSFPVDIRHNSKIFREKLAIWAEKQVERRNG